MEPRLRANAALAVHPVNPGIYCGARTTAYSGGKYTAGEPTVRNPDSAHNFQTPGALAKDPGQPSNRVPQLL